LLINSQRKDEDLPGFNSRSIGAYDAADLCLYDLGHVCSGAEVDAPLDRALADPRSPAARCGC
jgi:hypothetical protein